MSKCFYFGFVFSVTLVWGDQNEYRLIRDLLAGYDKRVRPSRNYTESLNVTFGLALAQIIDVVSDVDRDVNCNIFLNFTESHDVTFSLAPAQVTDVVTLVMALVMTLFKGSTEFLRKFCV